MSIFPPATLCFEYFVLGALEKHKIAWHLENVEFLNFTVPSWEKTYPVCRKTTRIRTQEEWKESHYKTWSNEERDQDTCKDTSGPTYRCKWRAPLCQPSILLKGGSSGLKRGPLAQKPTYYCPECSLVLHKHYLGLLPELPKHALVVQLPQVKSDRPLQEQQP